jgi:hypothetical protein
MRPTFLARSISTVLLLGFVFGCEYVTNLDDLEAEPVDYPDRDRNSSSGTAGSGATGQNGGSGNSASGGSGNSPSFGGSTNTQGGSSGASAGGSGAVGGCQAFCDKITGSGCADAPTTAECLPACSNLSPAGCTAQGSALVACIVERGTLMCVPGDVTISGCGPEFDALDVCAACAPASDDDTCTTCLKQNCCSELSALVSDANASAFLDCIDPCTSQSCLDACGRAYPATSAKFDSVVSCLSSRCSSPCN